MPRFFFDVDDGICNARDAVGDDFQTEQMACREAESLLYAMAKDMPGTLQQDKLLVVVRDAAAVPVCQVQLTLRVDWLAAAQSCTTKTMLRPVRHSELALRLC